jgi:hypothetical protein
MLNDIMLEWTAPYIFIDGPLMLGIILLIHIMLVGTPMAPMASWTTVPGLILSPEHPEHLHNY